MITRRRAAVTATFVALFVSGLLLTAFGGTSSPSPPYVHERVLMLGESGRIIQGHVGDIVDVQLGDVASAGTTWLFDHTGASVRVTPVYAASMPQVGPPSDGSGMPNAVSPPSGGDTADAGGGRPYAAMIDGALAAPTATPLLSGRLDMVRLAMVATGVTTVRGWRVPVGGAIPESLPDFVFIVLVKR